MMRQAAVAKAIEEGFQWRHTLYHKSRREALTTLAEVMLEVRSANMMELASALPGKIGTEHDRYECIE